MSPQQLQGVYAAAITPLRDDYTLDLDQIPGYLKFLAERGCHGALVLGTTGEGTAFSPTERIAIFKAAARIREEKPEFRLLAGTGTPSLQETIDLNRAAFRLGFDGVLVLPPFYHRKIEEAGLEQWYHTVIEQSVPSEGALFAYHIPGVSGVPISFTLLQTLKDSYPNQFAGLKDSSGDPDHAKKLGETFGNDLVVFNGNDRLFRLALNQHAAGCITAPANVISPFLRNLWDTYHEGQDPIEEQSPVEKARRMLDQYSPAAPILKGILEKRYGFPHWAVRPPLLDVTSAVASQATASLESAGYLV